MGDVQPIDLAHSSEFRLGHLTVHPPLRQLTRDDGREEVLEPRVMQVLIALARAEGGIVTRDELTAACWEGRVVGEDAINRVISRLRRVTEGIGQGSFRIETLTKVGYRLLVLEAAAEAPPPSPPSAAVPADTVQRLRLDRRAMLAGSGLAVVAAGGYGAWRLWDRRDRQPPEDVAMLMFQASIAIQQGTAEGGNQAAGLLRKVVEMHPDYADGWGMLALTYTGGVNARSPELAQTLKDRADEAMRRTEALDPDNAYLKIARLGLRPRLGNWAVAERVVRPALARHPDNPMLPGTLAGLLMSVGRCREAAELMDGLMRKAPPTPGLTYSYVQVLWAAGRLDDADRAMAEAYALFPTHFAVWFTRFYFMMYTGRAEQSLAMHQNVDGRPMGITDANFAMIAAVARAMLSKRKADIDEAIRLNVEGARIGAGFAENTVQFASALGRLDTAFEVADAYFFERGFTVAEQRFPEQRMFTPRSNRRTHFLFLPSTTAMRVDPRFDRLAREIRLTRYWREMGVKPDYQA